MAVIGTGDGGYLPMAGEAFKKMTVGAQNSIGERYKFSHLTDTTF